jgi:O-antigen/teichoic acid export membrane protein
MSPVRSNHDGYQLPTYFIDIARSKMTLKSRYTNNIAWSIGSTFFQQGSTFLANIIIANMLGKQQFGEFSMVLSTMFTFSGIAQLALGITATKYVAEYRFIDKAKAGRLLGLCSTVTFVSGFIASLLLVLSAPWMASYALKAPHLSQDIMISAGFVLFVVMSGFQIGALSGMEAYKAQTVISFIYCLFLLPMTYLGLLEWGLKGALWAFVVSAIIRWLALRFAIKREAGRQGIVISNYLCLQERPIIWKFAIPAAASGFTTLPAMWIINAFVVRQNNGFMDLSLFAAAMSIKNVCIILPTLFNNASLPILNNSLNDSTKYWHIFYLNIKSTLLVIVSELLFVAFFGSMLLKVYGEGYEKAYLILVVLMISALFEIITSTVAQLIVSSNKMWLSFFIIALPRDILLVLVAFFLVPVFGSLGLAISYTVSWGVVLLTTVIAFNRLRNDNKIRTILPCEI